MGSCKPISCELGHFMAAAPKAIAKVLCFRAPKLRQLFGRSKVAAQGQRRSTCIPKRCELPEDLLERRDDVSLFSTASIGYLARIIASGKVALLGSIFEEAKILDSGSTCLPFLSERM